jgi:hypothetical protein
MIHPAINAIDQNSLRLRILTNMLKHDRTHWF